MPPRAPINVEAIIQDMPPSSELSDVESVMMRFGHGDCHDLTRALSLKHDLPCMMVVSASSGVPIHSFVVLDGLALDGYGLNPQAEVLARYAPLCRMHYDEDAILKPLDRDNLDFWAAPIFDDESEDNAILAEFQILLDAMGVTL